MRVIPAARLLGAGRYRVLVSAGGGWSRHDGIALTRWSPDPTGDAGGMRFHLAEPAHGRCWSIGAGTDGAAVGPAPGGFAIQGTAYGLNVRIDVSVHPSAGAEFRVVRIDNASAQHRALLLASYVEVALDWPRADWSHPAFSKLFIQTEAPVPGRVLLARRRPRLTGDHRPLLVHAASGPGRWSHQTDRARFLGRGRGPRRPAALARAAADGDTGNVLDPILSLASAFDLAPGARAEFVYVLGADPDRAQALALADLADPRHAAAAAAAAAREERAGLVALGLAGADPAPLEALAAAVLYADPALRVGAAAGGTEAGYAALRGLRVAPERPYLLIEPPALALLPALRGAQRWWHHRGLELDLVALGAAGAPENGFTAIDAAIDPETAAALRAAACAVLDEPVLPEVASASPAAPVPPAPAPVTSTAPARDAPLAHDNGLGGFAADGREYLIRLHPDADGVLRLPPMPWVNVIANPGFGTLVSETGAGCTWSTNSRTNRLTPHANDPILDPHHEALYLRDETSGDFWSPLPGPVPDPAPCEVRHGFGYSRWQRTVRGLDHEVLQFVAVDDPIKIVRLRITNPGRSPRQLTAVFYLRLVLGELWQDSARHVASGWDGAAQVLLATNPQRDCHRGHAAFAAIAGAPTAGHGADRQGFLGRGGDTDAPAALLAGTLDGRTGTGLDPCFALAASMELAAGASTTIDFLLGEADGSGAAVDLVARYRAPGAIDAALAAVQAQWDALLGAVRVATPEPAFDALANGWLLYQTVACRLWGRSAFYQSGGAFGFRDQLQDSLGLIYARPADTRAQILLHAGHQFVEGDVLHWWHPPASTGLRTRFSDDLLWLPYVTLMYVEVTGDRAVLDARAPFRSARALADGEDEAYVATASVPGDADVYTHCCLALDRSLTRGSHGLPLMGTGDWNDAMNRIGREGRGESVWLGFFLYDILGRFAPLCEARGDGARARRYHDYRAALYEALNAAGWDGGWYRRAYYDDGTPLGTQAGDECRIDALAQSWAVLSGAAPEERARAALDAVERMLVDDEAGIVRLLDPPFVDTAHDPGYIKGYVAGIRENGGQYTHGALWFIRALAEQGRNERAAPLLARLTPIAHSRDAAAVAKYQVEPYVVAADVYGTAPHVGRGGWTWYTGSSSWMYRTILESILGFTIADGSHLVVRPCVPAAWREYRIEYRSPDGGARYEITVLNPAGGGTRVADVRCAHAAARVVDGAARIPLATGTGRHAVEITLAPP
ncbi:MAG: glycosyl transferase [Gammaproteobacteria bacterium]